MDDELDDLVADLDPVALLKHFALDRLPVDDGAIAALEVDHDEAVAEVLHLAVTA